ncbi:PLP-dependent transferase [Trichoderma chlorosporum]
MKYERMPIEIESPEEYGYDKIKFHLSESSIADQSLGSLGLTIPDLTLLYNEHRGGTELRKAIAADTGLSADDVLITGGAAETPRAIGCDITFVDLKFESGFEPDLSFIELSITPRTKMVYITCPHNPTGTLMSTESLNHLVAVTKQKSCLLLVDETYRDVKYGRQLPVAASLGHHVLSVSSLSKSFGVPGIRLGWVITQYKKLQETFLAAKEQISISGGVINEWIEAQLLLRRETILATTIEEMSIQELLEWVEPVVGGTDAFYDRLLKKYKTYVGPGHWFEMPDTHFRLGFSWPSRDELLGGMDAISKALRDSE